MATKAKKASSADSMPVEDDERHTEELNGYIARNRDALNMSLKKARAEYEKNGPSKKTVKAIISEGRRRHAAKQ